MYTNQKEKKKKKERGMKIPSLAINRQSRNQMATNGAWVTASPTPGKDLHH